MTEVEQAKWKAFNDLFWKEYQGFKESETFTDAALIHNLAYYAAIDKGPVPATIEDEVAGHA